MLAWRAALVLLLAAASGYWAADRATRPASVLTHRLPATTYSYHGCPVFRPNDWYTSDLRDAPIDPHSAAILANIAAAYPNVNFAGNVDAAAVAVNVVPPISATPVVQNVDYGWHDDPWRDD